MFDRISTITAKATYAGLYLLAFGWLLWSMLAAADSWLTAIAAVILVSPFVVLIGNFVIGPVSLVAGAAAGIVASATAALIRFSRS